MSQNKHFRNNGAIGALLDEYEKALNDLVETIRDLSEQQLTTIVDHQTQDDDCQSIQSILAHVVQSGYTYVVEIRKWLGETIQYKNKESLPTVTDCEMALQAMFDFNVQLFLDYPNLNLYEYDTKKRINVRWGQNYDVEQLFEHAIVHVLRHRRQIEIFKIKLHALPKKL